MHVPCRSCTLALIDNRQYQWSITAREVDSLTTSRIAVEVVFQQSGWHLAPRSLTYDGQRRFRAALSLAPQVLHLEHAVAARACKGVATMPPPYKYVGGGVRMWRRVGDITDVVHPPDGTDLCRQFRAKSLAQEMQEVNETSASWHDACFVQFSIAGVSEVPKISQVAPGTPSIGRRRSETSSPQCSGQRPCSRQCCRATAWLRAAYVGGNSKIEHLAMASSCDGGRRPKRQDAARTAERGHYRPCVA